MSSPARIPERACRREEDVVCSRTCAVQRLPSAITGQQMLYRTRARMQGPVASVEQPGRGTAHARLSRVLDRFVGLRCSRQTAVTECGRSRGMAALSDSKHIVDMLLVQSCAIWTLFVQMVQPL